MSNTAREDELHVHSVWQGSRQEEGEVAERTTSITRLLWPWRLVKARAP